MVSSTAAGALIIAGLLGLPPAIALSAPAVATPRVEISSAGWDLLPLRPGRDVENGDEPKWDNDDFLSESTIRGECTSIGGIYSTSQGTSVCKYRDINGNWYNDYYDKGRYWGTTDAAPPPKPKPRK